MSPHRTKARAHLRQALMYWHSLRDSRFLWHPEIDVEEAIRDEIAMQRRWARQAYRQWRASCR